MILFQNVWCSRPESGKKEMDPLFWRSQRHYIYFRHEWLWFMSCWGSRGGRCAYMFSIFYLWVQDFRTDFLLKVRNLAAFTDLIFYQKSATVKHVLSDHSKKDKTKILITNGSWMKVEIIAECSKGSILQYFWPSLSNMLWGEHSAILLTSLSDNWS